jgi:DNA-directed RNA polymerase subunit RPC12/RpoP
MDDLLNIITIIIICGLIYLGLRILGKEIHKTGKQNFREMVETGQQVGCPLCDKKIIAIDVGERGYICPECNLIILKHE